VFARFCGVYNDFKVFTRVLWRFMTIFAPLTPVSGVPGVNAEVIHLKVGIQCDLYSVGLG